MIRKLLAAAILAATMSPLALAPVAAAQTAAPKFSTDKTLVKDIMANPEAKAAFAKVLPEIAAAPELEQGYEMTLKAISDAGYIPADKLKDVDAEFAKIK